MSVEQLFHNGGFCDTRVSAATADTRRREAFRRFVSHPPTIRTPRPIPRGLTRGIRTAANRARPPTRTWGGCVTRRGGA